MTLDTNVISTGCDVSLLSDGGGQLVLDLNGTPVPTPEPGTLLLLSTGIAGLVARRARGKQRSVPPAA